MLEDKNKNRIIFIDILRAFAVLMMVQGHTIDALLSDTYRDQGSAFYHLWNFLRGITAPIFLFTAGNVFTYLLRLDKTPFKNNVRIKKGVKRFFMLVAVGYFLRYPAPFLVYFGNVTPYQWQVFLTVDVLHLIGFGILFIIGLVYIAEKFKIPDIVVFSAGTLFFFVLYPAASRIDWSAFLPVPVAAYFYYGTGSLFPFFPWAGYVTAGALLGSYLANNPGVHKTKKFGFSLAAIGIVSICVALIGDYFEVMHNGVSTLFTSSPFLVPFRVGLVLILNSAIALIAIRVNNISPVIINIGRNTFTIYIMHLVIIYGSCWTSGLAFLWAKKLDVTTTLLIAVMILALMVFIVEFGRAYKIKRKMRTLATIDKAG